MAIEIICQSCGTITVPKKVTKGSLFIEIILWLVFFPVGIIYSVWRLCSKVKVCVVCGNEGNFVPKDSPIGKDILARQRETKNSNASTNIADQLEKMAILRDKGIISEDEFNKKKSELLA